MCRSRSGCSQRPKAWASARSSRTATTRWSSSSNNRSKLNGALFTRSFPRAAEPCLKGRIMRRRTFIAAASATLATAAITATHAKEAQMQEGPGYVDVNGVHMYYEVHGTGGTPLVLLHGAFSATGTSFAGMLSELSRNRTVISFELQGHGHTADIDRPLSGNALGDDVAKALAHLGIGQADLFGYSLGAGVALRLAIDHPKLVRRL